MRIFVAGATGAIGVRLVRRLVADGHEVAGMTRSEGKVALLRELGAEPVGCDVFDAAALTDAVERFAPEAVIHELTDLPDDARPTTPTTCPSRRPCTWRRRPGGRPRRSTRRAA